MGGGVESVLPSAALGILMGGGLMDPQRIRSGLFAKGLVTHLAWSSGPLCWLECTDSLVAGRVEDSQQML